MILKLLSIQRKNFIAPVLLGLLFSMSVSSANAQLIKTYLYDHTPVLGPFAPSSLPAIGTVFAGTDPWGLPWFSGDPDTVSYFPYYGYEDTAGTAGISDQVIMERVINFCGQTGVQFRIRSETEQDVSYLYLSPNSNPEFATELLALPSTDPITLSSPPITPEGGIFIRAYYSDDADTGSFFIDWWSIEQPFWKPLSSSEFVAINTYGSSVTDSVVCFGDSTTVTLDNSDIGTSYVLRADATNEWLDGPYLGTGAPLPFNTGPIDSTTSFNILSLGPNDALEFDGINDYVEAPNNPEYELTDGTIELWLKPTSVASNQTIIAFENSAETLTRYSFHYLPSLNGIGFDNGSSVETIVTPITADVWQQLSIVDNGTNTEVFIDGVSVGTFPTEFGTASDASMKLFIGGNGGVSEMFAGCMEEVRIWDIVKTVDEINADADSCLLGSEPGLVAYYRFEDGTGSFSLQDVSTASNDGTLTNMNLTTAWVASNPETCTSCDIQMYEVTTVYTPYAEITINICENDSLFIEGEWQNTAGVYFDTLASVALGCDSIIETTLIIDPVYSVIQEVLTVCEGDSLLVFGTYYTEAGIYYDSLTSVNGCDSVRIQELVTDNVYFQELPDQYICPGDSVLIFGEYVTLAGVYQDSLTTVLGCDSVLQITLEAALIPSVGILDYALSTVCAEGGPVSVPLASPAGGVYSGLGVGGGVFDPDGLTAGTYYTTYTWTSNHGCSASDSAAIDVVSCLGSGSFGEDQEIILYPNPNNGMFTLQFSYIDEPVHMALYNYAGRLIYSMDVTSEKEFVELPNPQAGMYLMILSNEQGVAYRQIVVE